LIWLRIGTCERGMNSEVPCTVAEEPLAAQEGLYTRDVAGKVRNCSCCTELHAGTPQHSVRVAKRSNTRVNKLIHCNNVYTYSLRHEIPFPTKNIIPSGLPTCVGTLPNETFPNIDMLRI
jgi:hypothetical protein